MDNLKTRLVRILTPVLLAGSAASADEALIDGSEMLDAAAAASDIGIARDRLEHIHPGYDRYTDADHLAGLWSVLETRAADGLSRGELYLELSRVLAAIRCDHTRAELPDDMAAARNTVPIYLPFQFVLFDGRMYVDEASPDSGLARGAEITHIDGRAVDDWLAAVQPLMPVDGDATHTAPAEIAYSTEFMGPGFDHFAPFLADIETTVNLQVLQADGSRTVTATRLTYAQYQTLVGKQRYSSNFADSIRFERLGDDAAYLAVDSFINYRQSVDAMATLAPYFEILMKEKRDKLIVDLRRNGGGSSDARAALLRHLITRPVHAVAAVVTRFDRLSDATRRYLSTWNEAALNPQPEWFHAADDGFFELVAPGLAPHTGPVPPADQAFAGELAVLIGPGNSSGSTHLLAVLANAGRGLFVGEKTGGAPTGATAGIIYLLTLPESGIKVRIPGQRTIIAKWDRLPARDGLEPAIAAPMTRDDYFAGRDPALEAAKRALAIE